MRNPLAAARLLRQVAGWLNCHPGGYGTVWQFMCLSTVMVFSGCQGLSEARFAGGFLGYISQLPWPEAIHESAGSGAPVV